VGAADSALEAPPRRRPVPVAEGAGALTYAALEQLKPGPSTVAVVSGGNIDPKLLASLLTS